MADEILGRKCQADEAWEFGRNQIGKALFAKLGDRGDEKLTSSTFKLITIGLDFWKTDPGNLKETELEGEKLVRGHKTVAQVLV